MDMSRYDRVYVHWPIGGAPLDVVMQAVFATDPDVPLVEGDWVTMERSAPTEVRLLLAGPDVSIGSAVLALPLGRTFVRIRCPDHPQQPVRSGGVIEVI